MEDFASRRCRGKGADPRHLSFLSGLYVTIRGYFVHVCAYSSKDWIESFSAAMELFRVIEEDIYRVGSREEG